MQLQDFIKYSYFPNWEQVATWHFQSLNLATSVPVSYCAGVLCYHIKFTVQGSTNLL